MPRHRIKVPSAGENIETMTVLEWHTQPGEHVTQGDELVTIETDKVDIVIPSPIDGTLTEILAQPDNQITPGDPLCIIETPT